MSREELIALQAVSGEQLDQLAKSLHPWIFRSPGQADESFRQSIETYCSMTGTRIPVNVPVVTVSTNVSPFQQGQRVTIDGVDYSVINANETWMDVLPSARSASNGSPQNTVEETRLLQEMIDQTLADPPPPAVSLQELYERAWDRAISYLCDRPLASSFGVPGTAPPPAPRPKRIIQPRRQR